MVTDDQINKLIDDVGVVKTLLIGVSGTKAEGIVGAIRELNKMVADNKDSIALNRRNIFEITEECKRNHAFPPVTVIDENEFTIRMTKRRLAWWLTLIIMVLATIIIYLISGTDYFNLFNRGG